MGLYISVIESGGHDSVIACLRGGRAREPRKHWDVLRDLAIEEDRPDEVLRWHDQLARRDRSGFARSNGAGLSVARAVASTHPERAIDIYRAAAEKRIDRAKPDAYCGMCGNCCKSRSARTSGLGSSPNFGNPIAASAG